MVLLYLERNITQSARSKIRTILLDIPLLGQYDHPQHQLLMKER